LHDCVAKWNISTGDSTAATRKLDWNLRGRIGPVPPKLCTWQAVQSGESYFLQVCWLEEMYPVQNGQSLAQNTTISKAFLGISLSAANVFVIVALVLKYGLICAFARVLIPCG
jgi:hypothetical protein